MNLGSNSLDFFQIIIGIYLIYSGIRFSGGIFKDETIHKTKREEYRNKARIWCLVFGPIAIIASVLSILKIQPIGNIVFAIFGYGIFAFAIIVYRMTDKYVDAKTTGKKQIDPNKIELYNKMIKLAFIKGSIIYLFSVMMFAIKQMTVATYAFIVFCVFLIACYIYFKTMRKKSK